MCEAEDTLYIMTDSISIYVKAALRLKTGCNMMVAFVERRSFMEIPPYILEKVCFISRSIGVHVFLQFFQTRGTFMTPSVLDYHNGVCSERKEFAPCGANSFL